MKSYISILEDIVRNYPELLDKRNALRRKRTAQCKDDPTAAAALAELPKEDQRRLDALTATVRHTRHTYVDGRQRMLLIQAAYWGASFPTELEKVSALRAQEWKNDFLSFLADQLDLTSCTGCIYLKPLYWGSIKSCQYCYETGLLRVHDENKCYSKQLAAVSDELPDDNESGQTGGITA